MCVYFPLHKMVYSKEGKHQYQDVVKELHMGCFQVRFCLLTLLLETEKLWVFGDTKRVIMFQGIVIWGIKKG